MENVADKEGGRDEGDDYHYRHCASAILGSQHALVTQRVTAA